MAAKVRLERDVRSGAMILTAIRTDPYNLYPFLYVLPSGGIFVGYYNEARILDPVTFETQRTLPPMPGNVNNPAAGRTYPLEGAAMMLPQKAPYTEPVTLLICGGSTNGAALVTDNCVSIEPDNPASEWTIERMPSQRVLPCITALPDGTYLIGESWITLLPSFHHEHG